MIELYKGTDKLSVYRKAQNFFIRWIRIKCSRIPNTMKLLWLFNDTVSNFAMQDDNKVQIKKEVASLKV
jgi:hypothetical protein